MPLIESYSFGSIRIAGNTFHRDVILLGDDVLSPWFRQAGGHVFAPEDLEPVIRSAPEIVVLGTGAFGRVRVNDLTIAALREAGADVVVERTKQAVSEYNALLTAGRNTAAALHLTC